MSDQLRRYKDGLNFGGCQSQNTNIAKKEDMTQDFKKLASGFINAATHAFEPMHRIPLVLIFIKSHQKYGKFTLERYFEHYCLYCASYGRLIPVGLVLGFFVDVVVKRWWGQFQEIPWPDEAAMMLSAYVLDDSPSTKQKMKTFMRYINLANIITLRFFCSRIKKRYPFDQILIADGMMTPNELKGLQNSTPKRRATFYAAPLYWAGYLLLDMRASGLIMSDRAVELLYKNIAVIRAKGAKLVVYNMIINVPLGFTQVATMTIYVYVIASTFSWQFLDVTQRYNNRLVDFYIPIFGMLQLIFFLGWINVAEALINPFGEDPDDFAMDKYNERDIQISNFIIDKLHSKAPPLSSFVPQNVKAPSEYLESGTTSPTGLLARKSISVDDANLFMGSCAKISNVPERSLKIRRRTFSHFE
ncbi:hypothetical protein ACTXT7_005345 [Hymenolepis weldensis]